MVQAPGVQVIFLFFTVYATTNKLEYLSLGKTLQPYSLV